MPSIKLDTTAEQYEAARAAKFTSSGSIVQSRLSRSNDESSDEEEPPAPARQSCVRENRGFTRNHPNRCQSSNPRYNVYSSDDDEDSSDDDSVGSHAAAAAAADSAAATTSTHRSSTNASNNGVRRGHRANAYPDNTDDSDDEEESVQWTSDSDDENENVGVPHGRRESDSTSYNINSQPTRRILRNNGTRVTHHFSADNFLDSDDDSGKISTRPLKRLRKVSE